MTNLYLIRHAKSEANTKHMYGMDTPLSEEGHKQADAVSKAVPIKPDVVISGTKIRQIQTAEILFPTVCRHDTTSVFDEIDFGRLEGEPIDNTTDNGIEKDILSIKSVYHGDNVWERAEDAIQYISGMSLKYSGKTIAIITSDTLIQSVLTRLVYGRVNGIIWSGKYYIPNCVGIHFVINDDGSVKELILPPKDIVCAAVEIRYGKGSKQYKSLDTYEEHIVLGG